MLKSGFGSKHDAMIKKIKKLFKKLEHSKRGIAFTILGIILSVVIILAFSIKAEYRLQNRMEVIKSRVETANNLVIDIENDLQRGLYITGFNSLLAIDDFVNSNGTYVDDIDSAFMEALLNGTIKNTQIDLLVNNSFKDWTEKIKAEADKVGVEIDITILNLSISQKNPWEVEISSGIVLYAKDKRGTSSWNRLRLIVADIDIQGFEDPFYSIGSFGRVSNPLMRTNVTDFSQLSGLVRHINNSLYKESAAAPDFLMRLEGKFSASPNGIESIVNLNKFSAQQLQTYSRSNVDYIYFGNQSHSSCLINETQGITAFDWFRLDNGAEPLNHLDNYGLHCKS